MEESNKPERAVPLDEFVERIGMPSLEITARKEQLSKSFMPFRVTEHFTGVIEREKNPDYKRQLANIVLPPLGKKPFEGRFDPYGNVSVRQEGTSYLQHKYENTLLFHIDDYCIANCQFCYKVRETREERAGSRSSLDEKLERAVGYLRLHPEVDNVLFTGGDPAAFRETKDLIRILRGLAEPANVRVLRFATKGLAYYPQRFQDEELLAFFREINNQKRLNVIAHYNHPAEIEEESKKSLRALQESGVQIYGQPVILRGVNDDIDVLVELQNMFLDNNIQSYYLVAFMPVKGAAQYALPLEESFQLAAESKRRLNGLAKKGMLIAPHNWGKLEVCGFLPSPEEPEKIILKWHEVAMPQYLPEKIRGAQAEDILLLEFKPGAIYCVDDLFEYNGLPSINIR